MLPLVSKKHVEMTPNNNPRKTNAHTDTDFRLGGGESGKACVTCAGGSKPRTTAATGRGRLDCRDEPVLPTSNTRRTGIRRILNACKPKDNL